MAYLKKDDYTLRITQENFDEILVQAAENSGFTEDQVQQDAEETAQEEMGSILRGKYLIDDEFAKDGTAPLDTRNKIVMKCAMDIALYHLHWTINPRDIPLTREKAYESCIAKMEAYRDGELIFPPTDPDTPGGPGIDPIPPDEGGVGRLELRSHVKFISKPYSDPKVTDDTLNDIE